MGNARARGSYADRKANPNIKKYVGKIPKDKYDEMMRTIELRKREEAYHSFININSIFPPADQVSLIPTPKGFRNDD